ncbi:two-component system, sensor histidine kinase YesM [Paenibacillus sp. yr247]|uniref:sensor histidine kinase n=1 Tax=Paenibacillus sp. yr247 TaxID=1761880 RepID=UPI0008872852|nr:histidine kinase [Paenibacillus sp. yr247]SDN33203.1 two-component system, sensor histidine kinase YesM [Paenibacillus sp. yr247]
MQIWMQLLLGINRSFRIKLILSLSLIILLAFGVTGYLTYTYNLKLFEEEISKQFSRTNEEALAKMELKVQEIVRVSQTVVFNPQIEKLIRRINSQEDTDAFNLYYDKKQIEEQIFQIKSDAPYITGMYLYDLNGNPSYFSYTTSSINNMDASTFQTIQSKLSNTYGNLAWMSMSLPSSIEPSGFRKTIIIARLMKNSSLNTYGVLVMAVDESFFASSLKELTKDGTGEVYLFNENKELLYSNSLQETAEKEQQLRNLNETQVMNNHLYVQGESKATSFKLVSSTSLSEIQAKNKDLSKRIVYTGLISILLTSVLIVLSTGKLLRPLKDLLLGLRKVRSGDFDTRIEIRTKDELAYIAESFNAMAEQVGRLIKEVYLTQLSEREAELKALQVQLNPHFLHNMFNEIYWKLYLQNEKETAALIATISEMLKYSLMPVRTLTTVREEFQQIRNYVKLQTELFETDLETIIQADEQILDSEIMRFLLQPLVENVFVHGFRNKVSHKVLLIRARNNDGFLEIEVTDNGCGMDETAISLLLGPKGTSLPQRSDGRESLGVRSVVRRIELVYGQPYRLEVSSVVDSGTTMRLILPNTTTRKEISEHAEG